MFNLLNKYRFTANGDTTVTPVNTGLKRRWELQDDGVSYRKTLATELVFKGSDYEYFTGLIEAGEECEVSMLIEKYCSGDWSEYFTGRIVLSEHKRDYDSCEISFRVQPDDSYQCAKENFGEENNWLTYGTAKTLVGLYGTIEAIVCDYDGLVVIPNVQLLFLRDCFSGDGPHDVQFDPDPDPDLAWTPVNHNQIFTGNTVGVSEVQIETRWEREIVTQVSPPPGYGWVNLGGDDWARPITVISSTQEQMELTYTYDAVTLDETFEVSNGRLLSDVLESAIMATGCVDEVVSNFFNINPDGTNPENDAYDFAKDVDAVMQEVLIFRNSDVINPDASNDATYLPLRLTDVLNDLRDGLNVHWAIVNEGGTVKMRVEHWSYFEQAVSGINLVTLADGKYIDGLKRYELEGEVPTFESFTWQQAYSAGFLKSYIRYSCPTGDELPRQTKQMNADFPGIYANTGAGYDGFMFVCAYLDSGTDYLIDNRSGVANGSMKWLYILQKLWPFGRPSMQATGPGSFEVETVKKRKVQAQIVMPFCCDDFEPTDLVTTQLGDGQVKSAEDDTEAGTMTLNLLHT